MAPAVSFKTWLLVLPAVALLGVAGMRMTSVVHADDALLASQAQRVRPADPVVAAPALPEALARRLRQADMSAAAVPSGLPLDIRADIEGDTDLFAYSQRLRAQADAGNVEARWMLSRVYDYCSQYAMDPGGYRLDNDVLGSLGLGAPAAMVQARDRVAVRCGGFVASDNIGADRVWQERRVAAAAGNLAAEAALFAAGMPLLDSAGYRRDLVERVRDSRDPEAYMALAPAMGIRAAGDKAMDGMVAGEPLSELAWRVSACRLGMACGADSVVVNSFCANGGICSQDVDQDLVGFVYDAAVSRQGAEQMNNWVDKLIRKGQGS